MTADLDQGRDVPFGPIQVSQAGLTHRGQLVPWNELKSVQFGRSVRVETHSQTHKWPQALSTSIPNLPLLRQTIERFSPST